MFTPYPGFEEYDEQSDCYYLCDQVYEVEFMLRRPWHDPFGPIDPMALPPEEALERLREACREDITLHPTLWSCNDLWEYVVPDLWGDFFMDALEREIMAGNVAIIRLDKEWWPAPLPWPGTETGQGAGTETRTWIEVLLLDDRSCPMVGERCRVTLPSGIVREGRLDGTGQLRLDGLEAGTCDVAFPDIDGREWNRDDVPLGTAGAEPTGAAGRTHRVVEGETALRVAVRGGFRRWETVWHADENAPLRALRKDPNVLCPGDTLHLPQKWVRTEECATRRRHRFRTVTPRERLALRCEDRSGEALSKQPFVLRVGSREHRGQTDAEGRLSVEIPVGERTGELQLPDRLWRLRLGTLDPVDEELPAPSDDGPIARLRNLAQLLGRVLAEGQLPSAIAGFQAREALAITSELDEPTRTRLRDRHRS